MKVDIKDLLDDYCDEVNLELPDAFGARQGGAEGKQIRPGPQTRGKRPLLIAAALLLVVTAGVSVPLALSRTPGSHAMEEGGASVMSMTEELSSALPTETAVPTDDPEETPTEATNLQDQSASYYTVTETRGRENVDTAYGNMFLVDGAYYTLTENGPEPIETTNLHTTVELYGTWEVDLDYAVVDGELVFHNNATREEYAIIDGEKVTLSEYFERTGERGGEGITWIRPDVAIAEPVKGSSDTVMLGIKLEEKAIVDNCYYTFFYNIFTGEISDPLANVPELFDHGQMSHVDFNSARTRAIVHCFGVRELSAGSTVDGAYAYICDLETGELTPLEDVAAPYMPESENTEAIFEVRTDGCAWVNDDTLLFQVLERTPNGKEWGFTEAGEYISDYDYCWWMYSYNVDTGTVNYQKPLGDIEYFTSSGWESEILYLKLKYSGDSRFYIMDTATGAVYLMDQELGLYRENDTASRTLISDYDNGILYLVDVGGKCWVKLSGYVELPALSAEDYFFAKLVTNDWLCLTTDDAVYCCPIPEDLSMTPLTEK